MLKKLLCLIFLLGILLPTLTKGQDIFKAIYEKIEIAKKA